MAKKKDETPEFLQDEQVATQTEPDTEQSESTEEEPVKRQTKYIHYEHRFTDEELANMYRQSLEIAKKINHKLEEKALALNRFKTDLEELEKERKEIDEKARQGYEQLYEETYVEYNYQDRTVSYLHKKTGLVLLVETLPPQTTIDEVISRIKPSEPELETLHDKLGDLNPELVMFFDETFSDIEPFYYPANLTPDMILEHKRQIIESEAFHTFYEHRDENPEEFYKRFFELSTKTINASAA